MSTRNNPFEELERLFERMSRQFEESSRRWESEGPFTLWASEFEPMAIDLLEHEEAFVATVDLPGFERDDVSIEVTDHTLQIEAEREESLEEESAQYLRRERHQESARRSIQLPGDVDKENVKATMKNGVLTITLPKLDVEESQKIEIEIE